MIRQILVILSLMAVLFATGCRNPIPNGVEVTATPMADVGTSQFGPVTLIGEPISRPLPQTNEVVRNCSGGSQPITKHPALASANSTSIEWEVGGQFGSGVQIGVPVLPVSIDLSAVFNVADQTKLEQILQQSVTWDLSAGPGEIVTYTLSWEELWQQAYIDVTFANQATRRITVNYRTGIRSDIVAESMQFCDGSEPPEPAEIVPQPTPEPQASPTPMPVSTSAVGPDETLPYHADWSQGFNGWAGDRSWKTVSGIIVNDGTEFGSIMAPYKPSRSGVADYAVEAEIQVIQEGRDSSFGIIVRSDYYAGYIFSTGGGIFSVDHHAAVISINECPSCYATEILAESPSGMDNEWHTYRVEVIGNEMQLLIDGREFIHVTDNRYLTGGEVGLWSLRTQVQVRNFKVEEL